MGQDSVIILVTMMALSAAASVQHAVQTFEEYAVMPAFQTYLVSTFVDYLVEVVFIPVDPEQPVSDVLDSVFQCFTSSELPTRRALPESATDISCGQGEFSMLGAGKGYLAPAAEVLHVGEVKFIPEVSFDVGLELRLRDFRSFRGQVL